METVSKSARKEIPITTFADCEDPLPGFLEIDDFVVQGGGSMAGEYLHRLVATDVCSGWVEAVPLLAPEQTLAVAGLMRIREQMPVTTLGIDSDNDGAFINETVASYGQTEGLAFTRSRPHHKNDLSWIEQKNGAVNRAPVSDFESVFFTFVILPLASVHHAMQKGLLWTGQAVERDFRWFFSLPIPRTVWENSKPFQDPDLVKLVEDALEG